MQDAADISPDPETLMKLAEVTLSCEMGEEALDVLSRVLTRQPENLQALLLKANAHRVARQDAAEEATVEAVIRIAPDDYRSHTQKGRRLQRSGDFQKAEPEFLRSIELKPKQGVAYYGVISGRKVTESDVALVESMEGLVGNSELSEDDSIHLQYGLGKAFNDLGDYGRAMSHYDEANRLVRRSRPSVQRFAPEAMKAHYELIPDLFSASSMAAHRSGTPRHPQPIVVAGFMRSGTTLTEQILSRHPQIGAAGELPFWQDQEVRCVDYGNAVVHYDRLAEAAEGYEKLLAQVAPCFGHVTDKNPANHTSYGLVHIAFPEARILHLERNPVDVAISVWTTMMRTAATFVNDKANIALAIKLQRTLTRHWREALPQDRFKVVSYEDLTSDPERIVKECLEFIGLEWSDDCLSPERSTRLVSTPSLWQVRQPVYTSSVERWRRYEPWLGPFAELIE
jgi:tetratricopeptide (TPR) repeat protein